MSYQTLPNAAVTDTWSMIATGAANVTIQLLGYSPVTIFIGAAAPAAGSVNGHVLRPSPSRDMLTVSGLTTEKVYARVATGTPSSVVAITTG